jgi:hypothetical protein
MAGIEFFVELMELSFFYGGQEASRTPGYIPAQ